MPLPRGRGARCERAVGGGLQLVRLSEPPATMQDSPGSVWRSPGAGDVSRHRRGPLGSSVVRYHSARVRLAALKCGLWHLRGLNRTRPGTEGPRRRRSACKRTTPTAPRDETAGDIYTQIFTHMSQVHWGHVGTRPDSVRVFTHRTTQSRWKTWPHNKRTHSSPASNEAKQTVQAPKASS